MTRSTVRKLWQTPLTSYLEFLEFFSLKKLQFALRVHVEKCDNVICVIDLFIYFANPVCID